MMFIKDTSEIKEWILYGKPKNRELNNNGLIKMPKYENVIKPNELKDLISYLKVVMELIIIEDSLALKGYNIAQKMGCFGCHGKYGLGGMPNPNSLKGYIPGWDDKEFNRLVLNDNEIKEWILEGEIKRLELFDFILDKQVIKMPKYKNIINDDELNALIYYIKWIRKKSIKGL